MTDTVETPWWLLRYSPGPAWNSSAPAEEQLAGHREFVFAMHGEGHLVAVGPTPETPDTATLVLKGMTRPALEEALAGDLGVREGRLLVDITEWNVLLTG